MRGRRGVTGGRAEIERWSFKSCQVSRIPRHGRAQHKPSHTGFCVGPSARPARACLSILHGPRSSPRPTKKEQKHTPRSSGRAVYPPCQPLPTAGIPARSRRGAGILDKPPGVVTNASAFLFPHSPSSDGGTKISCSTTSSFGPRRGASLDRFADRCKYSYNLSDELARRGT